MKNDGRRRCSTPTPTTRRPTPMRRSKNSGPQEECRGRLRHPVARRHRGKRDRARHHRILPDPHLPAQSARARADSIGGLSPLRAQRDAGPAHRRSLQELERISERAPRTRCACWLPDCHSAALNPWQAGGVSSDPTRDPRGAVRYAIERSISQAPAEEGQEGNAWLACRNYRVLRP